MLPRLNSHLRAYLGSDGASLALHRGWRRSKVAVEVEADCEQPCIELTDVIDALGRCLAQLQAQGRVAGLRCDVIVADVWIAYEVIDGDLADLQPALADQAVIASVADTLAVKPGALAVCWQVQGQQRQLACAVPRAALERLKELLRSFGVRLGTVEGEFVQTFNAHRVNLSAPRTVLAVVRDVGTQLGLVAEEGFAAVRFECGRVDSGHLLTQATALLRCAGFDADERVQFVALAAPSADMPDGWIAPKAATAGEARRRSRLELDLAGSRARVSASSRLLLAAGIVTIAGAVLNLQDALIAREQAASDHAALLAALNEATDRRSAPPAPRNARAAKAAASVMRDLSVPWPALMTTFESAARSTVALLAVEPASQRSEVRFAGEAKDSAAMLDYIDALRGETLGEVTLVSHQLQTQTAGTPIRFQARALWSRPLRTAELAQ